MSATNFIYKHFEIAEERKLRFYYELVFADGTETLCEEWVLPVPITNPTDATLQHLLRQLHIGVGISYFKAFVPPVKHSYDLSTAEATYWNTVYREGLGEFSYHNNIEQLLEPFEATGDAMAVAPTAQDTHYALLGIGGGKDSIVAGELLKKTDMTLTAFVLTTGNNHGQTAGVIDTMDIPQLQIERYLDRRIIDITSERQGYNGHVPISMLFAWAGVLLAYLTKTATVVVANEAAANVGNVEWQGRMVNHQWSKSLEFEQLMQQFVHEQIAPDITYTSVIRPYSSLMIAQLFVALAVPYLEQFTSCNLVFRIDPAARPNGRWCGHCAKCLSSYLLLAPFLNSEQMLQVFGKNLLTDMQLEPTLRELLGLQGHKPMDCVGTTEELRACARELIARGDQSPLLTAVKDEDLAGPNIADLTKQRHPHVMPAQLFGTIEHLVQGLIV